IVVRAKRRDRVVDDRRRWRHVWQQPTARVSELEGAVGTAGDSEPFLVDRTMMSSTQQREVGERRGAAVRPVADVMALGGADVAAGKATPAVPILERAP